MPIGNSDSGWENKNTNPFQMKGHTKGGLNSVWPQERLH